MTGQPKRGGPAKLIVACWLALTVLAGIFAPQLAPKLSGGGWRVPAADATLAAEALSTGFTGRGEASVLLLVRDRQYAVGSPEFGQRVASAVAVVRAEPELRSLREFGWTTLTGPASAKFTGRDGHTVATILDLDVDEGTAKRVVPTAQESLSRLAASGVEATLVGQAAAYGAVNTMSSEGLVRAEVAIFPILAVMLLLIYRSVVAALVSLLVGGSAVLFATGTLAVLADTVDLSVFVSNVATMLSLGVGVDYAMIMIKRFAEEIGEHADRRIALRNTLRTAGHVVAVSGATITAAIATLLVVDVGVVRSMAVGGMLAVAFATLTSVVLLPALLFLLGPRIDALRVPLPAALSRGPGLWYRLAHGIRARPIAVLTAGCALLAVLAVPGLHLQVFNADAEMLPADSRTRTGYLLAQEQFGPGTVEPITVVIESEAPIADPGEVAWINDLAARLRALENVDSVSAPADIPHAGLHPDDLAQIVGHYVSADRRTVLVDVYAETSSASESTQRLVHEIRSTADAAERPGFAILVGGDAADGITSTAEISRSTSTVLVLMLALILVLLVAAFRSIFVPIKAVLLNLFSVGATIGILVLVFQEGWGAELLGITAIGPIQNFVPLLLFTILFSLSTDYEVFLITRIREYAADPATAADSIAHGLARTGPLISAAAAIMVLVFGAFVLTPLVAVQQLGFGMAVAVAIDATVVRMFLVPAGLELMGRWNWWLPFRSRPTS
ncbi:MMPL family transporter [Nocardia jiangsuensis]|uniref:MMPL family transporter n=1 Tax=Nocardia jiangsuensis TaxID=1691563 RepID=A0ABV8DVW4_9NOCA